MIAGIGTDIVSIARITSTLERTGERFARRILTEREFAVFQQRNHSSTYLASRFAAKEAASKALGTGIGTVSFQDIEVTSHSTGAPVLSFLGRAKTLQQERGITHVHISLSDEQEYAQAFVILEQNG